MRLAAKAIGDIVINCVLVVATVLLCITVWTGLGSGRAATDDHVGHKVGERAPVFTNLSYAEVPATLLLFVRPGCHFCTESMAFYRRLAAGRAHVAGRFRLAVVSVDPEPVMSAYLKQNALVVDRLVPAAMGDRVNVRVAPLIMRISRSGGITDIWVGKLSSAGERQIESRLERE